jgi:hypothetical protein
MTTFQLKCDRILQGDFTLGELNLIFVFQVNCPGCFIYGFPQAERLHQRYISQGLKVLGLSTAFEDFDYNTAENVELLLSERRLIGATKRALGDVYYTDSISFPIASDRLTTGSKISTPENIELLCQRLADYENMNANNKAQLHQKVAFHLSQYSRTSATFALNFLEGTPSFVLCDRNLEILDRWFGHESEARVITRIGQHLRALEETSFEIITAA